MELDRRSIKHGIFLAFLVAGLANLVLDVGTTTWQDGETIDSPALPIVNATVTSCTNSNGTGTVTARFANIGTAPVSIHNVDMIVRKNGERDVSLSNHDLDLRPDHADAQDDIELRSLSNDGPRPPDGQATYRIETGSSDPFDPGYYWFEFRFPDTEVMSISPRCQVEP